MAVSYTISILGTGTAYDSDRNPVSITANIIINDGSNWYSMSLGGIPIGTIDIPSYLNAEAADLFRQAQQGAGRAITQGQAQQEIYAALHTNNRAVFVSALYALDNGIATMPSVTLANYRTVLTATLTIMATLPTAFVTHFNNECLAAGFTLPLTIGTMTLPQCYTLDTLIHNWLNARHIQALVASNLNWWLQINGS